MLRCLWLFNLLSSTLFGAETWAPAREYWGPEDAAGFLQPILPPKLAEETSAARPDLQVLALNQKGFLHRGRREAELLGPEPLLLNSQARIYSPSQSFVALQLQDAALIILHAHTAISARPLEQDWELTFTGERGLARVSTKGRTLTLRLKPADPETAFSQLELEVDPNSDLYLQYNRARLTLFTIRGRVSTRMPATRPLQSARPEGWLQTWEEKQLRRQPQKPYDFEIFAGQELQITAAAAYVYRVTLPHAGTWQSAIARTSPQLTETPDKAQPLTAALLELRRNWLKSWTGSVTTSKETLYRFLQEGRWEEAYELVKTVESEADLEYRALAAICLYRLQQEALADKKQEGIDPSSLWADITRQEFLRSRLRRGARRELKMPKDLRHAKIPGEELYLLATNEQAQGRWRSALDLWERWPDGPQDLALQTSAKEWQRHLDQKKPWSFAATLELGWSDNVLHVPADLSAPPGLGHRSSWLLRGTQKLSYLWERSEDFRVHLEASVPLTVYQHVGLAALQRWEPGLALPLRAQAFAGHHWQLKPYISRLMQGSGGLDRFGYELRWHVPAWTLAPELIWAQEQNLDFAPTLEHHLDALSGERVGALDRSVRLHTLGLRTGSIEALWQSWDYRYVGSEEDDRQRFLIRGSWQKEFSYDLRLNVQGSIHHDRFTGSRSAVSGIQLRTELSFLYWHRREPTLAFERSMRLSADTAQAYSENLILAGLHYRW